MSTLQKQKNSLFRRLGMVLLALVLGLGGATSVAVPAHAGATVLLSGSSWFGGNGVNVCSNNGSNGTQTYCGTEAHVGGSDTYGWWQCVELAQRFYQKQGWYPGIFSGVNVATDIYDNATSLGMTRQANGNIMSIVPGDMIVHGANEPNSGGAGHVAIVNSISGSTVNAIEQNTTNDDPPATYTLTNGTLTRSGSGTLLGVVHDPDNTSSSGGGSGTSWTGVGYNSDYLGVSTLYAGDSLESGEYIMPGNGQTVLVMQTDGNLVLYKKGAAVWNSGTGGHAGAYLVVQTDGNVVIYRSSGPSAGALWNTETNSASRLSVQSDGNLVAYNSSNQAVWNSGTAGGIPTITAYGSGTLTTGNTLDSGEYLRSGDGRYYLLMQSDGNLVLYGPGYHVIWNSGTYGNTGAYLVVQSDGNVVIYKSSGPSGGALWNIGSNKAAVRFVAQSDGNLVAYKSNNQASWNTGTGGKI